MKNYDGGDGTFAFKQSRDRPATEACLLAQTLVGPRKSV
jgi:hypothetical protein